MSIIEDVPSASESGIDNKISSTLSVIIVLGCPPFKKPARDYSLTHRGLVPASHYFREEVSLLYQVDSHPLFCNVNIFMFFRSHLLRFSLKFITTIELS